MSIVVRFPPSNVTKEQYDSVRNALIDSGDWPADGCLVHVCFGDLKTSGSARSGTRMSSSTRSARG
jgi:hypothetical protein